MESDKRNIITFCIFAIALLISVASAESSIGISTGVPKIISMGQGVSSDFYQEVTLSLGVKNIGEQKGSFRLFAKNDRGFRLKNDWYGTLSPGETKDVQLKLISDPGFYGRVDYKVILEESVSGEQDIYEDSFYFQKEVVAEKDPVTISQNERGWNNIIKSNLQYIIVPIVLLLILILVIKRKKVAPIHPKL